MTLLFLCYRHVSCSVASDTRDIALQGVTFYFSSLYVKYALQEKALQINVVCLNEF
jgi:hypothetical protein